MYNLYSHNSYTVFLESDSQSTLSDGQMPLNHALFNFEYVNSISKLYKYQLVFCTGLRITTLENTLFSKCSATERCIRLQNLFPVFPAMHNHHCSKLLDTGIWFFTLYNLLQNLYPSFWLYQGAVSGCCKRLNYRYFNDMSHCTSKWLLHLLLHSSYFIKKPRLMKHQVHACSPTSNNFRTKWQICIKPLRATPSPYFFNFLQIWRQSGLLTWERY